MLKNKGLPWEISPLWSKCSYHSWVKAQPTPANPTQWAAAISAKISANSRGRGRKRGGGGGVDTRKCFNCGESGHLSNECPKPRMTGSELGKIKKAKKQQGKKTNKSKGVSGGGAGNAKGTKASNERQRKRNEKNKSSRANHNRKKGALKKAGKGM